jgi:hypothetical protein
MVRLRAHALEYAIWSECTWNRNPNFRHNVLAENWPSGLRDANLTTAMSDSSRKNITIILSLHFLIHCWNLVCFFGLWL